MSESKWREAVTEVLHGLSCARHASLSDCDQAQDYREDADALSPVLAQMKREWQAEVVARVESTLDDMTTWCGPYGHQGVAAFIDRRDAHIRAALRAEASGQEPT